MTPKQYRAWTDSSYGRLGVCLLEVVLILIPVILYLAERGDTRSDQFDLSMDLWSPSAAILEEDGSWYTDEKMFSAGFQGADDQNITIESPRLSVPAGWYTLQVTYECTARQSFAAVPWAGCRWRFFWQCFCC